MNWNRSETGALQVPAAVRRARKFLGTPCDQFFLTGNDRLYCCELAWECFRDSAGRPLFDLTSWKGY